MRNTRLTCLPVLVLSILLTGCVGIAPVSIEVIEEDRIAKQIEKKKQEDIRREAIAQEKEEQRKQEIMSEMSKAWDRAVDALTNKSVTEAQKVMTATGMVQDIILDKISKEEMNQYYKELFGTMQIVSTDCSSIDGLMKFTAMHRDEEKLESYLRSKEFAELVADEQAKRGIWTDEVKKELTENAKRNAETIDITGSIKFRKDNENWLVDTIVDQDSYALIPSRK